MVELIQTLWDVATHSWRGFVVVAGIVAVVVTVLINLLNALVELLGLGDDWK